MSQILAHGGSIWSSTKDLAIPLVLGYLMLSKFVEYRKLSHVPTVGGPSLPLLSWLGCYNFVRDSKAVLRYGYERYKGRLFKVAMLDRWLVLVTGPQLIEELRVLPESDMSLHEALCQIFEMDYTLGDTIRLDPYHAHLLHSKLTRHLGSIYPVLHEELVASLHDTIQVDGKNWVSVPVLEAVQKIVCRGTNRIVVGLPICRDPDYLRLQLQFTADVGRGRKIINLFPPFLKPFAGRWLTTVPTRVAECRKLIEGTIDERRAKMAEYGVDYPDKPMDMLQWFMDYAHGDPVRSSTRELAIRVLVMNFASIHTTANTLAHALYTLAAHPEYIQSLREEVDAVVAEHGWTRASIAKMHRVDSFLHESVRVNTLNGLALTRIALKDHIFSDGTFIPRGTFLAAPTTATHDDDASYAHPGLFDPLRFVRDSSPTEKDGRQSLATTNPSYIAFGHGKAACPGRIFASAELKTLLAHIVVNFDVRTEAEGKRPPNRLVGITNFPGDAKVLFRRR